MKNKNLIIAGAIALPVLAVVASFAYMTYTFASVCQNTPHKNYMKEDDENE